MTTRFIAHIFIFVLLAVSFVACTDPDPNPANQTCYVKKAIWGVDYSMLFSYNAADKLTEQRLMKGSTEIAKYTYTYNTQGNVSKMTSNLTNAAKWFSPVSHDYIYNANNQLIEVKRVFSPTLSLTNKFTLDNLGKVIEDNQVSVGFNVTPPYPLERWMYKTAYTYNIAGNATISTNIYHNETATPLNYQFDDKKNLYKNFPLYAPIVGITGFISPSIYVTSDKSTNMNNWQYASIPETYDALGYPAGWRYNNIAYTYNLQGYPITETYSNMYSPTNITYEYDCK